MEDITIEVLTQELNKKIKEVQELKKQLKESLEEKHKIEEEVRKLDDYKPEIDSVRTVPKQITFPNGQKANTTVTMIYYKPLEIQNSKVAQAFLEKYPYNGPKPITPYRKK